MKKDRVHTIENQWHEEIPELETESMACIGRLNQVFRHIERRLSENYTDFGLNSGEFDVLATLKRSGSPYQLKPTELYNTLMITSGAMTNRIDTLEKKGLVKRENDPEDRRAMYVVLTEKGHELIQRAVFSHVALEKVLLDALKEEEVHALSDLLSKLLISYE